MTDSKNQFINQSAGQNTFDRFVEICNGNPMVAAAIASDVTESLGEYQDGDYPPMGVVIAGVLTSACAAAGTQMPYDEFAKILMEIHRVCYDHANYMLAHRGNELDEIVKQETAKVKVKH